MGQKIGLLLCVSIEDGISSRLEDLFEESELDFSSALENKAISDKIKDYFQEFLVEPLLDNSSLIGVKNNDIDQFEVFVNSKDGSYADTSEFNKESSFIKWIPLRNLVESEHGSLNRKILLDCLLDTIALNIRVASESTEISIFSGGEFCEKFNHGCDIHECKKNPPGYIEIYNTWNEEGELEEGYLDNECDPEDYVVANYESIKNTFWEGLSI